MANLDNFRSAGRFRSGNRLLQVLLSLSLIFAVNYLASRYYHREDLTRNQQFSLSPETLAYLDRMENPVEVFVTYTPESNETFFNYVQNLLDEYVSESRKGGEALIQVEYVNIYQQRRRAQELVARYGIQEENQIVIVSEDRQVEIDRTALFEIQGEEIAGFTGEQAFTSAILEVSDPNQPRIYFTVGHGEKNLDDVHPVRGLSRLAQILQDRNYQLATVDLSREPEVPLDANLVIVAGPQAPFLPLEVEKLRNYLSDQNGRLIVLVDPYQNHGLEDLFFDWGLLVDDMVVIDRGADALSVGGELVIRRFADHPITRFLLDYQLTALFGPSRPVRPDPGAPFDEQLSITPLIGTSETSWGERSYRTENPPQLTPGSDLEGPLQIATLAERRVGEALGIHIPGGRLMVFGDSDFITNNRVAAFGNNSLFLNTIRWSLERNAMLNIPAKTVETTQLVLSGDQLRNLLMAYMSVPVAIAILGFGVSLLRKR